MKLKILYRKIAIKFIKKNLSKISKKDIDELIIKAMKKIIYKEDTNIDLKRMISNDGFFRIRKGNIRIFFSYSSDGDIIVSLIEDIGFRGDIYK